MSILIDRQIAIRCLPQGCKVTYLREMMGKPKGYTEYYLDKVVAKQRFGDFEGADYYASFGEQLYFEDLTQEDLASVNFKPMIAPFVAEQVRYLNLQGEPAGMEREVKKVISFGLSSAGYDVRLGRDFKIFTNVGNEHPMIDPLNLPEDYFLEQLDRDYCIIPPHSYVLGHTIEVFNVPKDILIECVGKSTYARCGIAVNVTPIEPGFEGQIVIEIANQTPLPCKVYSGMGIAQFLFHQASENCQVSYGDRKGKYQNQRGIQTALV